MESRESSERRRAAIFARRLEERGITTSLRAEGVAVLVGEQGEALRLALFQSHPELLVSASDGQLLLDIRSISEEEFSRIADTVAAEVRKARGLSV